MESSWYGFFGVLLLYVFIYGVHTLLSQKRDLADLRKKLKLTEAWLQKRERQLQETLRIYYKLKEGVRKRTQEDGDGG